MKLHRLYSLFKKRKRKFNQYDWEVIAQYGDCCISTRHYSTSRSTVTKSNRKKFMASANQRLGHSISKVDKYIYEKSLIWFNKFSVLSLHFDPRHSPVCQRINVNAYLNNETVVSCFARCDVTQDCTIIYNVYRFRTLIICNDLQTMHWKYIYSIYFMKL